MVAHTPKIIATVQHGDTIPLTSVPIQTPLYHMVYHQLLHGNLHYTKAITVPCFYSYFVPDVCSCGEGLVRAMYSTVFTFGCMITWQSSFYSSTFDCDAKAFKSDVMVCVNRAEDPDTFESKKVNFFSHHQVKKETTTGLYMF